MKKLFAILLSMGMICSMATIIPGCSNPPTPPAKDKDKDKDKDKK